mmetsp:Transcript_36822/g.41986  ORF Transcript_36822/g.41986 Transcript_36822/m.41986 type:complete len:196 (+) Transcript_36822:137-724(+)|eukprot:CAMPEP_0194135840 /NCGR_PEP_ID=MMETSP0152-20130528/5919_1 /TAXON_ID=1049557 /ORGANISM="Thalassiothrix antarctica, Strain L6-D1" /LENGTH=195 /DNA_ID=CAMNT_0038832259 /DNA_START=125 /DNA_END=712 /DNA_ORIENTATION=-
MSVDVSQYKVGLVLSLEDCGKPRAGKLLRACLVNVGSETSPADNYVVSIVTTAANVREGSRLAVALEGSTIINDEGEEVVIKKQSVGGVMSEGMFCDSRMLGWTGGSTGSIAQVIPPDIPTGSAPPAQKPRRDQPSDVSTLTTPSEEDMSQKKHEGLFERKPTKEERKKLNEERRRARAAKKAPKKEKESAGSSS